MTTFTDFLNERETKIKQCLIADGSVFVTPFELAVAYFAVKEKYRMSSISYPYWYSNWAMAAYRSTYWLGRRDVAGEDFVFAHNVSAENTSVVNLLVDVICTLQGGYYVEHDLIPAFALTTY